MKSSSVVACVPMPKAANSSGMLSIIMFRLSPKLGSNIMTIQAMYIPKTAKMIIATNAFDFSSFASSVLFMDASLQLSAVQVQEQLFERLLPRRQILHGVGGQIFHEQVHVSGDGDLCCRTADRARLGVGC